MKKVLVTGASGFIGRYVVAELLKSGHQIIVSSSDKLKIVEMPWIYSVKYIEFNLKSFNSNINYFEYFGKPDVTIHLAWEGLPGYKFPYHYEVNLPRHYQFLKNLVSNGCRDLTVTGTCFEYGMKEGMLSEDFPTSPTNAYALAKDCLNKFLCEFQKSEKFIFRWLRLFYMYGTGQSKSSLFSQLENSLSNNDPYFNMSPGLQIRDYLPVEDVAFYIVKAALQRNIVGNINCCSGVPISVKEMVEGYIDKRKKKIKLNLGYYPYPDYEPMAFWGDNTKLQMIANA